MNLPNTSQRHAPLHGILLVLIAVTLFAGMDTAGKYLMTKYNVPFVAAVRYSLNLILLLVIMAPRHGASLWKTNRTGLVVLRAASLACASFFAGLALQSMPVGETVALLYLQSFGVIFAAGYFLGERISSVGWIATIVGFIGVLLIARPGNDLAPMGVVFALLAAAVSVVYVVLSRVLTATESTMAMLFHVALVGTPVFIILSLFNPVNLTFTTSDLLLLLFMGTASLTAHFLFTSAYRYAPATLLAPFNYFHIALAAIMGWLFYNHVPDGWSLLGMALIAGAGAATALHTHLAKSKST